MSLADLASRWTQEAGALARWGDERGAAMLRMCAAELGSAAREHGEEALTITQAAAASGCWPVWIQTQPSRDGVQLRSSMHLRPETR